MSKQEHEDIATISSLLAECIRRMGASYGSPEEWRADFTAAVKIMEKHHLQAQDSAPA